MTESSLGSFMYIYYIFHLFFGSFFSSQTAYIFFSFFFTMNNLLYCKLWKHLSICRLLVYLCVCTCTWYMSQHMYEDPGTAWKQFSLSICGSWTHTVRLGSKLLYLWVISHLMYKDFNHWKLGLSARLQHLPLTFLRHIWCHYSHMISLGLSLFLHVPFSSTYMLLLVAHWKMLFLPEHRTWQQQRAELWHSPHRFLAW